MADKTYKRMDEDQLIFFVQYLFTKLKTSPLSKDTTYTLSKDGNNIVLKDGAGTTISTVADDNTTYSAATTSANGLMTKDMVTKLDGIAAGANKTTADSALSATSTNPVQNKTINTALGTKANASDLTSHTGNTSNPHNVTATQVGLGNVNNTSDADKPISTATQTALNAKADTSAIPTRTSQLINDSGFVTDGTGGGGGSLPNNILIQYVENNSHKCIAFDILG